MTMNAISRLIGISGLVLLLLPASSPAAASAENTAILKNAAAKMKAEEYQEALDLYLDAIDNDDEDWRPYQGAGNAYRKMGKDDKALEFYKKALDLKGEDPDLAKKIEDMESAAEEEPESKDEGLKPIRGGESSNMAVAMRNRPQPISAAGSYILFGYGVGYNPNGNVFDAEKAGASNLLDDDPAFSQLPLTAGGDLQYVFVGNKESKVGFRGTFSYGLFSLWSESSYYYYDDYPTTTVETTQESSVDSVVTGLKLGGDLLVRLGKNAFVFGGLTFTSARMKYTMSYSYSEYDWWNDYYVSGPIGYDVVFDMKGSGVGGRLGFLLIQTFKNKFTLSCEASGELSSVGNFKGQASGDFSGTYEAFIDPQYGVGFTSNGQLPPGAEKLKINSGGFSVRIGLGVNFGRPPMAPEARQNSSQGGK